MELDPPSVGSRSPGDSSALLWSLFPNCASHLHGRCFSSSMAETITIKLRVREDVGVNTSPARILHGGIWISHFLQGVQFPHLWGNYEAFELFPCHWSWGDPARNALGSTVPASVFCRWYREAETNSSCPFSLILSLFGIGLVRLL